MARGSFDFEEMKQFQKQVETAEKGSRDLAKTLAKDLAARLFRLTRKRTPRKSGALRKGWKVSNATYGAYTATIRLYNDTEYALYVEAGHRTRDHESYVPGRHMLAISTAELEMLAPKLIEKRVYEWLKETLV